jgi:hypothetical protein
MMRPLGIWHDKINMDLKRYRMRGYGLDYFDVGQAPMADSCESGNESLDSIKKRENF